MSLFCFRILPWQEGERIDKCIVLLMDSLSRSYIQKMIRDGHVQVNGKAVRQNYRVDADDEVSFFLPEAVEPQILPEDIPLDILYEDDDLLVVNKPKGMVVHPAAGHYSHTLVNAVLFHCKGQLSGINGVMRPGIVHRIDKDTTGSVLVCKNDAAHRFIAQQLKEHSIVRRNGKEAVTHYRVLQRFSGYTYIECRLKTGRTHQIRVHMASIGHPLLGDAVYGPKKCPFPSLEGQTLHAMILGFVQPSTKEYIETCAPLPDYFEHLLRIL